MTHKMGPIYGMLLGASIILGSCADSSVEIAPIKKRNLSAENKQINSYQHYKKRTFLKEIASKVDSIKKLKKTVTKDSDYKNIYQANPRKKNHETTPFNTLAATTLKKTTLLQQKKKSRDNKHTETRQAEEKFTIKKNTSAKKKTETKTFDTITTCNPSLYKNKNTNTSQIASHRTYYIFASKKELDKNKFSNNKNTIFNLRQTKKTSATTKHRVLTDIDYILSTNIYFTAQKPKILSIHPKSSYKLKTKGNACVLQIKKPHLFWSNTKILVIEK